MKGVFLFFFLTVSWLVTCQQQFMFGFAENPQSLILNPGAEVNYRYHVGVPFLSGFSFSANSTKFVLSDLFINDGVDFSTKVDRKADKLSENDYIHINTRIDILNGGYRYHDSMYISFGFYEELDFILFFPKDMVILITKGNQPFLNRTFSFSQLNLKADVLGVFHAGISKNINEKLTIGARAKIYSSAANAETSNNSGIFATVQGTNNSLRQYLNAIDVNIKSSGIFENGSFTQDYTGFYKRTLLGGNLGIGFDIGFTYHLNPQLELTGSLLDVGFIRHSKNTRNYTAKGDFVFEGIDFLYDGNNTDYWQELDDAINEQVPNSENHSSYTSWRPAKINAALKYSFGQRRPKVCYVATKKDYYYNAVGVQLHSVFRPSRQQFALTSFYEAVITEKFHTKITHTINDFSYKNVGAGFVAEVLNVNIFGMIDNILGVRDLASTNSVSLTFGINVVFD